MSEDIKLPALGEGIDSGDVAKIHVKEGSEVEVDTVLLELETEKALLELPSPVAGRITGIKISEGDTIKVGQSLFDVDTGNKGGGKQQDDAEKPESKKKEAAKSETSEDEEEDDKEKKEASEEEKKDSGKKASKEKKSSEDNEESGKKKPASEQEEEDEDEEGEEDNGEEDKESEHTASQKKSKKEKSTASEKKQSGEDTEESKEESAQPQQPESIPVPAGPGARRLARELGVDLRQVAGTARGGRITLDDVKAYTKQKMTASSTGAGAAAEAEPLPDFTQWGEVETKPIPSLRGKIASNLTRAWNAVPLVTQFDEADITGLESLRKEQAEFIQKQGGKLTMTVLVLEALVAALKQHPQFNASVDLDEGVIHYKKYYNIGIAVDTPSGLIVPVIKNVDRKSVAELAVELTELSERARNRKVKLEELRGGNISISNLGGIGGTAFTPLVRPPEVAVVGLSRTRMQPVYKDGTFQPRLILPFCVSYDHKLIDGADAARFARTLAERLENFTGTLLQG